MFRIVRKKTIRELEEKIDELEVTLEDEEYAAGETFQLWQGAKARIAELEADAAHATPELAALYNQATTASDLLREIVTKLNRFDPEGMVLPKRIKAACVRATEFLPKTTGDTRS